MRIPPLANRPTIELVQARSQIDLADAARHCGVPLRTLQNLNPGLKRGKTPRSGPHYVLVPLGTGDKLRRALAKSGKLETPAVADNVHTRLGDT
jgi:membrane-bound lytic murein transglycosylase D